MCPLLLLSPFSLLALAPAPTVPRPPLDLQVHAFIHQQYVDVEATIDPQKLSATDAQLVVSVRSADGNARQWTPAIDRKTRRAIQRIEARDLPSGKLTFDATVAAASTRQKLTAAKTVENPLKPTWLGTTEGITTAVPAPWTPLVVEADRVRAWGRTYRFASSPLPTEVITRDAAVLAGPVELVAQVGGKPIRFTGSPVVYPQQGGNQVTLEGQGNLGPLRVLATTRIEYDGMIRTDLALDAAPTAVAIESLALEIPLKPEHATYLYHFPGRWGSVANSGFLPKDGWKHAFKPFVWLGDEDRGLAWFCESDQNWLLTNPQEALTITREAARTVLRCRLIDHPVSLTRPLMYTFGLQATPVKKPEKTVWDYRITHHGHYGLEKEPAALGGSVRYPGRGHLRREEGSFECWYRPAFDSEGHVPLAQRKHPENHDLLTIRWGNDNVMQGTNCGLYYNGHVQGPVLWSRREGKVLLNPRATVDWKAGQWHHLAVTWGTRLRLYIDGKLASESPNTGFIPADPEQATIEIGGNTLAGTVDEIRILSVPRPPKIQLDQPAIADAETLLVDSFENYGPGGQPPGEVRGVPAFGPGRVGKALTTSAEGATQLAALAGMGVRTICFHEHWSPYQAYPYVTEENRPRLKSLVDGCHANAVNLLLYMSREMADIAPEWELRSAEVLVEPRRGGYKRQPAQTDWYVCWRSPWKDFCLHHLAKLLDETGHDGWYLDGPEWPQPCTNRHHGCGYLGPDGKVRPTWDIFATRDFMQRLYVLTRQRKPQAQLNIHNSTVMTIPTLGWGTSSWGGEQLDAIKPPVKVLDVLPMDAFRTEFMGRQWGVPSEFLVYGGRPYDSREMLAYTLLHGVLIRPSGPEELARISALWKIDDRFPLSDATFYPYWEAKGPIRCQTANVYVSAWQRPREGLLLVVSNLGDNETQAVVQIDSKRLNLSQLPKAQDALTAENLPIERGILRFALGSWRYRLIRIDSR